MIRNETFDLNGVTVAADCYDTVTRIYHREESGIVVESRPMTADEMARYAPGPLDPVGALATLLAVRAVLPVEEAAAAVGLPAQALVDEALAWGVAGQ